MLINITQNLADIGQKMKMLLHKKNKYLSNNTEYLGRDCVGREIEYIG